MTDRYERIRKALEGLRERCAQEAERITARRRAVAAMTNNEAVKPCEVAAAIRKIDVQQHYECAAREIERMRRRAEQLEDALREAREMVEDWAGYASEYFQAKHDLQGDLAKLDAVLREQEE